MPYPPGADSYPGPSRRALYASEPEWKITLDRLAEQAAREGLPVLDPVVLPDRALRVLRREVRLLS